MYFELTNLLPSDRRKKIQREYYVRLATVAVSALAVVLFGSGALLIPSYLFLNQEKITEEDQITGLTSKLVSTQGQQASARLANLQKDATYLSRLASTSSATASIRSILTLPHPGIVLSGVTYVPMTHSTLGKMTLSGAASTRENLRAYVVSLKTLPFVSNVDLPIDAYAKETAIPFLITLTGTLSP